MAFLAASTDAGTRKRENEDACCVEVARTSIGELLMAVVCDGVGGLSRGSVASSTVVERFCRWFEEELPLLVERSRKAEGLDFEAVQAAWAAILQRQNDLLREHGRREGAKLGTTFTGILVSGGRYLVGHVGDCRAYRMDADTFEQLTEDQTVVARRLAAGEITAEQAAREPRNVILQSVGTEHVVRPAFYQGASLASDLFVICCDGAYHKAGNEGVRKLFQALDYRDENALKQACDELLRFDIEQGEKDNLTVLCFSGALEDADGRVEPAPMRAKAAQSSPSVAATTSGDLAEDDLPTMVDGAEPDEDDLPTMVDGAEPDEDDLATTVDGADFGEDDLPTMVEGAEQEEDDLPTMVEDAEPDEDDLPTMVEGSDA